MSKKDVEIHAGKVQIWHAINDEAASISMVAYDMENPQRVGIQLKLEGYARKWFDPQFDRVVDGKRVVLIFLKPERIVDATPLHFVYEGCRVANGPMGDRARALGMPGERYRITVDKTLRGDGTIESFAATWEEIPAST